MTPPAITSAGQRAGASGPAKPGLGARTDGHPRRLRHQPAPSTPRRVSGPLGGRPRDRPTGRAQPLTDPSPRERRRRGGTSTLGGRAAALLKALPDHALIDRLLRGRAWIPVLGVMLAGIVAMQVSTLKLGASIGTSIQRGTALQSQNEQLRATVASLADERRIERLAAAAGMVMPAPDAISFLAAPGSGVLPAAAPAAAVTPTAPTAPTAGATPVTGG